MDDDANNMVCRRVNVVVVSLPRVAACCCSIISEMYVKWSGKFKFYYLLATPLVGTPLPWRSEGWFGDLTARLYAWDEVMPGEIRDIVMCMSASGGQYLHF